MNGIQDEQNTITVYRVDDKKHPRIIIDDNGNVTIQVIKEKGGKENYSLT